MNTNNAIIYRRVSTRRQGASGLGLEAQELAAQAYVKANGLRVVGTYTEVESGKNNDRPQLRAALLHAKRSNAVLVVARLCRLSRNAKFLLTLQEAQVNFVACDNVHASALTIGLLAIIAQHEAKMISDRTRAALQAAKARGVKLGSAREGHWVSNEGERLAGSRKACKRSAEVRAERAKKAAEEMAPVLLGLRAEGLTLQGIADRLNADGWTTRRGRPWSEVHVCKFLKSVETKGGRR